MIFALGIDSGRTTAKGEGSVLTEKLEPIGASFVVISLRGKFGELHACGDTFPHIVPLPNASAKPFCFNRRIENEGLPRRNMSALETSAQRLVRKPTHLPGEQALGPALKA